MVVQNILEKLCLMQDSMVETLSMEDKDLNVHFYYPQLADRLDKRFTSFYGVFKNVETLIFEPWEDDKQRVSSIDELRLMKMQLLQMEYTEDDCVKIYVDCKNLYEGGNLFLKAEEFKLYDQEFTELQKEDIYSLSEKLWLESKAEG